MAVAMLVDNPEGSQETYERVRERLGLERPAGGIFHVASPSPNGGWRVIEVWESEEDAAVKMPIAAVSGADRAATFMVAKNESHAEPEK